MPDPRPGQPYIAPGDALGVARVRIRDRNLEILLGLDDPPPTGWAISISPLQFIYLDGRRLGTALSIRHDGRTRIIRYRPYEMPGA